MLTNMDESPIALSQLIFLIIASQHVIINKLKSLLQMQHTSWSCAGLMIIFEQEMQTGSFALHSYEL